MKIIRIGFKLSLWGGMGIIVALSLLLGACYVMGPPPIDIGATTVFYDHEGNALHPEKEQQTFTLDDISPYVIDATLVTEDRHFYSHYGFDFRGIARAIGKNIKTLRLKEGASTISQQYARNLYLSHEKTWLRKWKEALYTIRLEMFYDKDDILTGYLHAIYYGHGAYGIEEASQLYFSKNADQLTLGEAAMLAGIPKGPTYYSPYNDEERAITRQQDILQQLLEANMITQAEYYEAQQEELEFDEPNTKQETFAAFFKDTVLKEAATLLHGEGESLLTGNYHIYTTLDRSYQEQLEEIVADSIDEQSELEISALSIESESGAIIGLIGGTSYEDSSFNRATDAKRMVGSTFKPFVYYTALENGYTPTTMLLSEPTAFNVGEGETYQPRNYNGYYANKPISLAQAVALSDNIYAVKTGLFLDPSNVIETTKKIGIHSELPNVPSLALGSASISLYEMVQAYGIFANKGKETAVHSITKITDANGKLLYDRNEEETKQILDPNKTFVLSHLMMGMFDRRLNGYMDVTGSSIIDHLSRTYAGKSGTTDTDSWMLGYSPAITTGVWTGFDDNKPIQKVSEKSIAKQVWARAMEHAHEDRDASQFEVPDGIEKVIIDPETGLRATSDCPVRRATYFEKGTEPTGYCEKHLPEKTPEQTEEQKSLFNRLFDLFN